MSSDAWTEFTDVNVIVRSSRGQYLSGSSYGQGGAFAQQWQTDFGGWLTVLTGGLAKAHAPADPESGTSAVDQDWRVPVGHAGVEVRPVGWWPSWGT